MAKKKSLKEKLESLGERSGEAEERYISSGERLDEKTDDSGKKAAEEKKEKVKPERKPEKGRGEAKGKKEVFRAGSYEGYFERNPDLEDQKLVNVGLYEDVHKKLSQLTSMRKSSTKTNLVCNILLDWFERYSNDIKKDKKEFLNF